MTPDQFRATYWKDVKAFLESPAGNWFRVILSKMRPQGHTIPIPGVEFAQLQAAAYNQREGYEQCVTNVYMLGSPPDIPAKPAKIKYHRERKKKNASAN